MSDANDGRSPTGTKWKEDVKTETIRSWDEDGNLSERQVRTIHVVQQKTGKKIVIPCNKALRDILDKYPDELTHCLRRFPL